jgi:hypothetical protein
MVGRFEVALEVVHSAFHQVHPSKLGPRVFRYYRHLRLGVVHRFGLDHHVGQAQFHVSKACLALVAQAAVPVSEKQGHLDRC